MIPFPDHLFFNKTLTTNGFNKIRIFLHLLSVISKIKMMEIERTLNDAMALQNINNGNPLRQSDD